MDLLKRQYKTEQNELLNTQPVYSHKDVTSLRSFCDFVKTKYRVLQALEVEEGVYSAIIVPMLLEKIPDTLRLERKKLSGLGSR